MVDMGVGENYSIEIRDRQREFSVFLGRFATSSLKHPAIECNRVPIHMEKVARACNLPGRSYKRYLQCLLPLVARATREEYRQSLLVL